MAWSVDGKSNPGVLHVVLAGAVSAEEMAAFVRADIAAVEAFGGEDYRIFADVRGLYPLSPEATAELAKAKAFSAKRNNFRGSAVWVASALVAMQHHRTSVDSGVMDTELISEDEAACWAHLKRVKRR
jgi:hypothetical protein